MVRYVLGGLLGIAVLVVPFGERGDLVAARHVFRHLAAGWVAAAVLAEGARQWRPSVSCSTGCRARRARASRWPARLAALAGHAISMAGNDHHT
jgi:hypothetical protein